MNRTFENRITEKVQASLPTVPTGYHNRIGQTILLLKEQDKCSPPCKAGTAHHRGKIRRCIAAAVCLFILCSGIFTFTMKPALAAELPFISNMVYQLSPTTSVNDHQRDKLSEVFIDAMHSLANGQIEDAAQYFYMGEGWVKDNDTLSTLYYLHYLTHSIEVSADKLAESDVSIDVSECLAEQKAFRYTADVTFLLYTKDEEPFIENATVQFTETISGLYITSIQMQSDSYLEYIDLYSENQLTFSSEGDILSAIRADHSYLFYQTVYKNDQKPGSSKQEYLDRIDSLIDEAGFSDQESANRHSAIEKERELLQSADTPEKQSVEDLAAELMFRYHLGRKSGEVQDFSDIMERTQNTDLFFYDAQLQAEKVKTGYLNAVDIVEKGTAEIVETLLSDDSQLTARFTVHTNITTGKSQGVGEEIVLTFQNQNDTWIITGYDRFVGDGVYRNRMKPLAEEYRESGMTWEDANKKAYDDLYSEMIQYLKNKPQ